MNMLHQCQDIRGWLMGMLFKHVTPVAGYNGRFFEHITLVSGYNEKVV